MAASKAQLDKAAAALMLRLSQQNAGWLISKPSVWLRDNAHVGGRNADGSYNAQELVAAMQRGYRPAKLSDADLELVMQAVDDVAFAMSRPGVVVGVLDRIEAKQGAAGLAAVGAELLRALREYAAIELGIPETPKPLPDEIRAAAEQKIDELAQWEAREQGRIVLVCKVCDRYRCGREWVAPPWPSGFAVDRISNCPNCEHQLEKDLAKQTKRATAKRRAAALGG